MSLSLRASSGRLLLALLWLGACGSPHPKDFAEPDVHGLEAKLKVQQCAECHGDTLRGENDDGVSCDSCHIPNWREDCTYCHGGDDDESGAPPRYIDGGNNPGSVPFVAHQEHINGRDHQKFDCEQCHVMPTDVLTEGHLFVGDATSGYAETDFSAGYSKKTVYDGQTCSDSYCHGTGQGPNGKVKVDDDDLGCSACHAGPTAGVQWGELSGKHIKHMFEGLTCDDCHSPTIENGQIIKRKNHVNGEVELALPDAFENDNLTCTGICHGQNHTSEHWN